MLKSFPRLFWWRQVLYAKILPFLCFVRSDGLSDDDHSVTTGSACIRRFVNLYILIYIYVYMYMYMYVYEMYMHIWLLFSLPRWRSLFNQVLSSDFWILRSLSFCGLHRCVSLSLFSCCRSCHATESSTRSSVQATDSVAYVIALAKPALEMPSVICRSIWQSIIRKTKACHSTRGLVSALTWFRSALEGSGRRCSWRCTRGLVSCSDML